MHGKLACGRPLVVRLASEKYMVETAEKSCKGVGESNKTSLSGSSSGQMNRSAKIAAIKNKLKALGEESSSSAKKQKQAESISCTERLDNCTNWESSAKPLYVILQLLARCWNWNDFRISYWYSMVLKLSMKWFLINPDRRVRLKSNGEIE